MIPLNKKNISFLLGDIFLISLSIWFAFLLRFEGLIPQEHIINLWGMIGLSLLIYLPVFYFFRLYSLSWSYVSVRDLITLLKANSLSFLLIGVCLFVFRDLRLFDGFPRSTFIISFFLVFLFTGSVRFLKRIIQSSLKQKGKKEKTLIVGAGDTGEQILRSIINSFSPYSILGFVDDREEKRNLILHGVKVLGKIDDIPKIIREKDVEGIIIALSSSNSKEIRRAVQKGRESGLKKIKIVPSVNEIMDGKISVNSLKSIDVENLLGRDPVIIDYEYIEKFISGKSVLVTGGAGSIGSVLSMQVAKFNPKKLIILDNNETGIFYIKEKIKSDFPNIDLVSEIGDVCDKEKIDFVLNSFKPDIVFHAAAYKHVPLMEENPEEAAKNNVFGTLNLAEICQKYNVSKFIFISTDKAVRPSSIMGSSKRIGEKICRFLNDRGNTNFISVRFGNVLDSRGSVIPIFREQIKKGGPVTVTHPDMKRYFMTISEACLLVMEAGAIGKGGEVFVLNMGKPVKILDLAREMIKLYGFEPDRDVPIVFSGIRPGEKLFEEILNAEEGLLSTESKKIFKAIISGQDSEEIKDFLIELKESLDRLDRKEIINIFQKIISN
jgi:FlaA1/EpsC-like NDP-sugar epimerase